MRPLVPATAVVMGLACVGGAPMGNPIPEESRFVKEWHRYLGLPEAKSLALAGDVNGRFVFGYTHGLSDARLAERRALAECELRRRIQAIEEPCRVFAVGNTMQEGERVPLPDEAD
jgi:hypothetical protein